MAKKYADRVQEETTTTGTDPFALAGEITGFQRFSSPMVVGDTCDYCAFAVDDNGVPTGDWEAGLGTYSAADTLTRTTVHESSNGGAAVTFGAGTKRVMLGLNSTSLAAIIASISTGGGGGGSGTGSWVPPRARFSLAADFTPTADWQPIPFDTVEVDDKSVRDGAHPGRIVIPTGVTKVRLTAYVVFRGNESGYRYWGFSKNAEDQTGVFQQNSKSHAWQTGSGMSTGWIDCAPGDYFCVPVADGNLAVAGNAAADGSASTMHSWIEAEFDDGTAGGSSGGGSATAEVGAHRYWKFADLQPQDTSGGLVWGQSTFADKDGTAIVPTASYDYLNTGDSANIYDGGPGGAGGANWDHGYNGKNPWVVFDFGTAKTLGSFQLLHRQDYSGGYMQSPASFTILWSDDKISWTEHPVHFRADPAYASNADNRTFTIPQTLAAGAASGGGDWAFDPPLAASVTAVSGDSTLPTLTDDADIGLIVNCGPAAADGIMRGISIPFDNTKTNTLTCRFSYTGPRATYTAPFFGQFSPDNSHGRQLWFYKNGNQYQCTKWHQGLGAQNSGNDGDISFQDNFSSPVWVQMIRTPDGGLQHFWSSNGKVWEPLYSVFNDDFSASCDHFVIGVRNGSTVELGYIIIDHLNLTAV